LLVDAAQGVEAQTIANLYLAQKRKLTIIPVINKIDLPLANPERVKSQLQKLGLSTDVILTSARDGTGIPEVLEAIVKEIPPPRQANHLPLKALIFDSFFDTHRGVIGYIRVFEGIIKPGMKIVVMSSGKEFKVEEVGILKLKRYPTQNLQSGEVGYFIANVKNISDLRVGDTLTEKGNSTARPLPGYRQPKSESSPVLGPGFRCGFLGLLHKEIVQERLEREFDLNLVTTAPNVIYHVLTADGKIMEVRQI